MTPIKKEAILTTTRDAARAIGLGEELDTMETGKCADIIAVDGDSLQDFIGTDPGSWKPFEIRRARCAVTNLARVERVLEASAAGPLGMGNEAELRLILERDEGDL